jgi:hypothetical protein
MLADIEIETMNVSAFRDGLKSHFMNESRLFAFSLLQY